MRIDNGRCQVCVCLCANICNMRKVSGNIREKSLMQKADNGFKGR